MANIRQRLGVNFIAIQSSLDLLGRRFILSRQRAKHQPEILRQIMTIEGLASNGDLHPLQEGFWEEHGLQCGFCTPGMILLAYDLLQRNPDPSEQEIREGLTGNLCRCTGYHNIVKAVQYAAKKLNT